MLSLGLRKMPHPSEQLNYLQEVVQQCLYQMYTGFKYGSFVSYRVTAVEQKLLHFYNAYLLFMKEKKSLEAIS